jgi:hypothetical protein
VQQSINVLLNRPETMRAKLAALRVAVPDVDWRRAYGHSPMLVTHAPETLVRNWRKCAPPAAQQRVFSPACAHAVARCAA